ncbi:MAG: PAS domain-containing protein [Planctomycetota bacterium]|jgi:PAS domain S-box-containing protein
MNKPIEMHKQVERTLRCLVKIAEDSPEGIVISTLDGTIRFVNTAWANMHGYNTPQELVGEKIDIFHTDKQMKADILPFMDETKHRGQLSGMVEHVRKDGTSFPTNMKMTIVNDDNGTPIALIIFATDITEQNNGIDELRQRCRRLEKYTEELAAQLSTTNKQLQRELAQHKHSEEELLESIIDAEEPRSPTPPPFNPQELKALSELAKRLA